MEEKTPTGFRVWNPAGLEPPALLGQGDSLDLHAGGRSPRVAISTVSQRANQSTLV